MVTRISTRTNRVLDPTLTPYLTSREREELVQLTARLEAECADKVYRMILYGSKARGDANAESDVDVMIVARDDLEKIKRVVAAFQRETDSLLLPQFFPAGNYANYRRLKLPFYVNVRRVGIELWDVNAKAVEERETPLDFWGGEFRAMDYETLETIRLHIEEAREKWEDALMLEKDRRPLRALPSAYYATFDWATAALYAVNVVRDKQKGALDAFSQFLVKPHLIKEEYKDIYQRLFDGRGWVDYGKAKGDKKNELTDDEARQLLRDTERFIARMEKFLRERGALD